MSSSSGNGFALVPPEVLALGNGYAIAVYAAIARHADRDGVAFPSLNLLAEITGWSRPTVIKAIETLVAAGAVVKGKRARNGSTQANQYRLPLHSRSAAQMETAYVQGSTTFTQTPKIDSPESTTFTQVAENGGAESTSFTSRVNVVDYPSKRRLPEQEPYNKNQEQHSPTTRKRASKGKGDPDPRVNAIKRAFCEAVGIPDVTNHAVAGAHAKKLLSAGVLPEDMPEIVAWLRSQTWMTGGFDLGTVVKFVDRWRASKATRQTTVRRYVV